MSPGIHVHGFPVGPFQSNTYIVSDGEHALVIDPGDEPLIAAAHVREQGLEVGAILLTHGHVDHVGAVADLEDLWDVDSWLQPDDTYLLDELPETCAKYNLPAVKRPRRLKDMADGQVFRAGAVELVAARTPGHSPGHVILKGPGFAIVGDLVFAGSVGRTDLPRCSTRALLDSIEHQVFSLPPGTVLYPGHGPATTVQEERHSNPFLQPGALE